MESKILIDIQPDGRPFLFIDFKASDDLRDKVLSRFIYESGALILKADDNLPNPTRLNLHILYFDQQTGRVQAMVEHFEPLEKVNEPDVLKHLDDMCAESLDPASYEKWGEIVQSLKNRRQSLK